MRPSVFNGLKPHGDPVEPWATSFFSILLASLSVSAVALAIMIGFAWVYFALLYGGAMSVDPGMGITEFAG